MVESTVEFLSRTVVDLTEEALIHVLHVDDDAGFLKAAKQILELQGAFEVETASSVEEAQEKMKQETFDVVVSDYVMSGKSGLDFLKELRHSGNDIPFIMFTGKGREEVAIKALNLGADRYLNKTGHPETVYGELAYSIRKSVKTKQAEEAVRENQQKFERLFMSNPEAADYLDPNFNILNINPRFEQLFGYSLDEIEGKRINDVIVPKDKMEDAEILDKEAKNGYTYHDTVRKRKDGSLVSVSISAAPIIIEGQLVGTVGLYKDITERKKAEEELKKTLENVHVLNEKLGIVGKLTRHDARNKLSAVTMNVFLAKKKLAGDHEALEHLSKIESDVGQVEKIFEFARICEKIGVEQLAYMNVEKSLKEAVMLFSDLHGAKIENDCHGLTVLADSLLRQILYNLIDNSLKHGESVSRIRLYYKETGKSNLKLVYEDDGVGISKAEKEKIFKEDYGKSTDHGLYLIRKICEVYGWTIRETGKQGKEAQFTISMQKTGNSGKEKYRIH